MKTTVEKLSPTRAKLTIAVTPEELQPSIQHAYEHIAEQVTIPGFRKGKVPPPLIDQRVGRIAVLEHAVNEGIDGFYRRAVEENDVRPIGRPDANVDTWPAEKDFSGELLLVIEVDVRPEVTLPSLEGITLTVDAAEVSADDVEKELDQLRSRFGTLVTVDRPAKTGDFAQIDLVASINGEEVDTAANISYEIGSGELIEGIDEALDTLTAGESTSFESPLMGGDHEGENAQITVTLNAVKERELPEADDDFAQISSEFDTIGELRADLRTQVERSKTVEQGTAARDLLVDKLLELVEIPVPEQVIEEEVHRHLEQESRLEDDEHRAEVKANSEKTFRTQMLLDEVAQAEGVKVSQDELSQYLVQAAGQYGMDPNEFVKILSENGQIPSVVSDVARNKALAILLGKTEVVDSNGAKVDLSDFVAFPDAESADEAPAESPASSAEEAPADETPAEEAPAAEKPKKRAPKKKAAPAE